MGGLYCFLKAREDSLVTDGGRSRGLQDGPSSYTTEQIPLSHMEAAASGVSTCYLVLPALVSVTHLLRITCSQKLAGRASSIPVYF